MNDLTGLGSRLRDKMTATRFLAEASLDVQLLAALYRSDDLAAKAIDKLPQAALKLGFHVVDSKSENPAESADDAKALEEACRAWDVRRLVYEGAVWGRLFGGAAIVLGVDGAGLPTDPLDDTRIRGLSYATVIDRRTITPISYQDDATRRDFGEVMVWLVTASVGTGLLSARVHTSRMIRFGGALTDRYTRRSNGGWDDSVLQRVYEVLRQANSNWMSVAHMMTDCTQAKFKITDLVNMIAEDEKDHLNTRMELVDMGRSVARAIMLDKDGEDFEYVSRNFAGVPEVIDRTWQRVAAAFDLPVTELVGISPAGLNATGEADTRKWYASIEEYREQRLRAPLERLVRIVARTIGDRDPERWCVSFPSLWQMTPKEEAELRDKIADTDKKYVDSQVALPEEIALSRFGRGRFATETVIDLDARRAALKAEIARVEEGAGEPDSQGAIQLTPSDVAVVITVNEARKTQGLPPISGPDGDLTIAEFKAKHSEVVGAAAAAEAGKLPPADQPPPVTTTPPPKPITKADELEQVAGALKAAREAGVVVDEEKLRAEFPDFPVKKVHED